MIFSLGTCWKTRTTWPCWSYGSSSELSCGDGYEMNWYNVGKNAIHSALSGTPKYRAYSHNPSLMRAKEHIIYG